MKLFGQLERYGCPNGHIYLVNVRSVPSQVLTGE